MVAMHGQATEFEEHEIQATKVELATIIRKQDEMIQDLQQQVKTMSNETAGVIIHQIIRYIAIGCFLWWVSSFALPWTYNIAKLFGPYGS